MAWIFDTYSMNKGHSVLGVVTGKPLAIGGSLGRLEATARGGLFALLEALDKLGETSPAHERRRRGLRQRRQLPLFAHQHGAKVIAMSDSTGGVQRGGDRRARGDRVQGRDRFAVRPQRHRADDERGADPRRMRHPRAERARAGDHGGECGQGQGVDHRRGRQRPDHSAADDILEDRGVLILRDVLANAGGVVVSYFEWVRGLQEYFWKEDEVSSNLHDIVQKAFHETWELPRAAQDEHAHGRLRLRRRARRGRRRQRVCTRNEGRPLPRPRLPPL